MPKRNDHSGVYLVKREDPGRPTRWRAKWIDPDSGSWEWITLDDVSAESKKSRRKWCQAKAKSLATRISEITSGAPRRGKTPLAEAVKTYLEGVEREARPATLKAYRRSVGLFATWAASHTLEIAEDLDRRRLASFRDWLVARPRKLPVRGGKVGEWRESGRKLSPASVNHDLRGVKALVGSLRVRGFAPRLSRDDIHDALHAVRGERPEPEPLTGEAPRKLLESAIRHDAAKWDVTRKEHAGKRPKGTTPRYDPAAPFVAFVLLTGARLSEALGVRWDDVHLDAPGDDGAPVGEVRLHGSATKTHAARTIDLAVSPGLRAILLAMKARNRGLPFVFGHPKRPTKAWAEAVRRRLVGTDDADAPNFGAPSFSWQRLRQTCASFLVNAPAIYRAASVFRAAAQLGHDVAVAQRHYLGRVRGIPADARSLDAAMGIEKTLRGVLAAVKARRGAAPSETASVAEEPSAPLAATA